MSTYNPTLSYLKMQIESLLSQDIGVDNFDIIIRDDGSSKQDALSYIKDLPTIYPNIYVTLGKNVGVFNSFWALINDAYRRGYEFVSLSDQDDIALRNKLSLAISFLEKEENTRPLLFFSQMTFVNDKLEKQGEPFIKQSTIGLKNSLFESSVDGNLMVLNRKTCELVLFHKPKYFYMHDWWIYICVSAFGKVIYAPVSTLLYRQHTNNVIGGTQSLFAIMIRRLKRFCEYSENTYPVYRQGKEFKEIFGSKLETSVVTVLNNLLSSKESFFKRVFYALSSNNFSRMTLFDNALLRLLILLNKY